MPVFRDVGSHLSGLEKLRVMLADGRRSAYAEKLDMRLVEIDDGRVVLEAALNDDVFNSFGTVHGGFAASLLDSACGYAAVSKLRAHQEIATIELKVSYHAAITPEVGVVRAEGKVLTIGRRIAFLEAKLTDPSGRLYASASSSLIITTRSPDAAAG